MAGQISISGTLTGLPIGEWVLPPIALPGNAQNEFQTTSFLATGLTGVVVPTWAVGVIVAPPTTSVFTYKIVGANGATGEIEIGLLPSIFSLTPGGQAEVWIACSGTESLLETTVTFF
jgi:hypothetical protein